jgi:hypothetical protein
LGRRRADALPNVTGTQTYLTMTPELLVEASQRFERYAAITAEVGA